MTDNSDKKIEFLYSAITDAQELIRFIDTKTGITITIIAAYVVAIFSCIENIVQFYSYYSFWFWLTLIIFIVFLLLSIWVIVRIIRPTNNPVENITIEEKNIPSLKFYLSPNKYSSNWFYPFCNSKRFKLSENFENYLKTVDNSSDTEIVSSLTFELFKTSYIRNIKSDRLNILIRCLLVLTISFFAFYLLYSIETQNLIDLIEDTGHKYCNH
ncbi:MAG: hypothetical protein QM535_21125 [Limnohabitans sp.]|nr:hypothetical protein [Limnohabitans sp.]